MEDYSTIRLGNLKAHIFCHSRDKVLCGVNRWDCVPFVLNKGRYNALDILLRHRAFAIRRGYPNPYKYTCMGCEKIIEKST